MCTTIQSIDELRLEIQRRCNEIGDVAAILYRGQSANWPLHPSAVRPFINNELWERDFDVFVQPYRTIHQAITYRHMVASFEDVLSERYPQYMQYVDYSSEGDYESMGFVVQCLCQQYARSAMFLDATSNLNVALFFGSRRLYNTNASVDGRLICRADRATTDWVYLSIFFVRESNIVRFTPQPAEYMTRMNYIRHNRGNAAYYFAIDMTRMSDAQRVVNQSSWFLGQLPENEYEHRVDSCIFDNVFCRSIFRMPIECVERYLHTQSVPIRISLFPDDDRILHWAERCRLERLQSLQENRLGRNDLGISIVRYFPELD